MISAIRQGNRVVGSCLPISMGHSVRDDAMSVGVEGHKDIWWCYEKQGDNVVVAQCCSKGWEEVLEACSSGDAHL